MDKDHFSYELSIVVPLYNETLSLRELHGWIVNVLRSHGLSYELIFVNDGSTDDSWRVIEALMAADARVKGIRFYRNHGKAAALREAFREAQGRVVVTMDADLQDSPDELPFLYKMVAEEGYDLVSGWRLRRRDVWHKRIFSKIFNKVLSVVFDIPLHDANCGLKAYRNFVAKHVSLHGEMHRFIALDVKRKGFGRIGERQVIHHARKYGKSKYNNPLRFLKCALDVLTASFITRFQGRPMHFFGALGVMFSLAGGGITLYLLAQKIYRHAHRLPLREVVDQPLFYLALTIAVMGIQLFLTGFLAEILLRHNNASSSVIQEKRGFDT